MRRTWAMGAAAVTAVACGRDLPSAPDAADGGLVSDAATSADGGDDCATGCERLVGLATELATGESAYTLPVPAIRFPGGHMLADGDTLFWIAAGVVRRKTIGETGTPTTLIGGGNVTGIALGGDVLHLLRRAEYGKTRVEDVPKRGGPATPVGTADGDATYVVDSDGRLYVLGEDTFVRGPGASGFTTESTFASEPKQCLAIADNQRFTVRMANNLAVWSSENGWTRVSEVGVHDHTCPATSGTDIAWRRGSDVEVYTPGGTKRVVGDVTGEVELGLDEAFVYVAYHDAANGRVVRYPREGGPEELVADKQPNAYDLVVTPRFVAWTSGADDTKRSVVYRRKGR